MRKLIFIILAAILMMPGYAYGEDSASRHVGKVLFIGDSMTGWLSERLEAYGAENIIAVHIRHIREKIEINPKEPKYLKVIWGIGYKIENIK